MTIEEALYSRSKRVDDCLVYTGPINHNGYGIFSYEGIQYRAHRLSYMLNKKLKILPSYIFICHTCDNPPCIEPIHLFEGTNQDNQLDAVAKGRSGLGTPPILRGQDHPRAYVTRELAQKAIDLYTSGKYTQESIVAMLNLSRGTLYYILKGKHWTTRQ